MKDSKRYPLFSDSARHDEGGGCLDSRPTGLAVSR